MDSIKYRGRGTGRGVGRLAGVALVIGFGFASPVLAGTAAGTSGGQKPGELSCSRGVVGYLGISGMICRDCDLSLDVDPKSLDLRSTGGDRVWSFSVEPRITQLAPGSPAARVLKVGDTIVAIDGQLITTAAGGRRFANIEANQDVRIRYRRGRQTAEVVITAEARCWPSVEGINVESTLSRFEAFGGDRSLNVPRVRFRVRENADGSRSSMTVLLPGGGAIAVPGRRDGDPPVRRTAEFDDGRLGISWSPEGNASRTRKNGGYVWDFSGALRVTDVDADGPAGKAGIHSGDLIQAVNGKRIESRDGGREFGGLRAGQPARFTLKGDDGVERTVTVVPEVGDSPSGVKGPRTNITLPGGDRAGLRAPILGEGRVGMNFSCGPCSSHSEGDRQVWEFSGPVEVTGVEVGGPAHRAGIQLGDEIVAVNGQSIRSREGADAFTNLQPGQPTRFTLKGRDGRERTVTVVPSGRNDE